MRRKAYHIFSNFIFFQISYLFLTDFFLLEMRKKCILQLSESITFEESQNWKNCDTLPFKILMAIIMSNFNVNI